jgi:N-acetyl-anhydromuramyl-L-alanine amidase AmpD
MTFKGYKINLRPIKIGVGVWNLEIEKNDFIIGRAINNDMTLKDIEQYAFNEIDKLIEQEKTI